jgi:hypothetical protein
MSAWRSSSAASSNWRCSSACRRASSSCRWRDQFIILVSVKYVS